MVCVFGRKTAADSQVGDLDDRFGGRNILLNVVQPANLPRDQATQNAPLHTRVFGSDVPVYRGRAAALSDFSICPVRPRRGLHRRRRVSNSESRSASLPVWIS